MKLHIYCSKEVVEGNFTYKFRMKIVKKERNPDSLAWVMGKYLLSFHEHDAVYSIFP